MSFPSDVALGARISVTYRTEIVPLASGHEVRNARWRTPRRRYDAGFGLRSRGAIAVLVAFYEARQGRRFAFRLTDPVRSSTAVDGGAPSATDVVIGVGDGTTTDFKLLTQTADQPGGERPLLLPNGPVSVAIDGAMQIQGEHFTIAMVGGVVSFDVPPALGAVVTAGCRYDVPVRFDTDELVVEMGVNSAEIPDVPLIEVRQ